MKYRVRDEVKVVDRAAPYYGASGSVYNVEPDSPWPVAARVTLDGEQYEAAYAEDELLPLAEADATMEIPVVVV